MFIYIDICIEMRLMYVYVQLINLYVLNYLMMEYLICELTFEQLYLRALNQVCYIVLDYLRLYTWMIY